MHHQFPNLYALDRCPQAFVAENLTIIRGYIVWGLCLRRNLTDNEVVDLCILLGLLDKVYLSVGKRDVWLWKPDAKGNFTVKSFYNVLIDSSNGGGVGLWQRFWDPYIPP